MSGRVSRALSVAEKSRTDYRAQYADRSEKWSCVGRSLWRDVPLDETAKYRWKVVCTLVLPADAQTSCITACSKVIEEMLWAIGCVVRGQIRRIASDTLQLLSDFFARTQAV